MSSGPSSPTTEPDRVALIRTHTVVASPYLCPELQLHLVTPECALWRATDADLEALRLPAPYWAFGWAGGQALGRLLLDGGIDVAGRPVVDFGSGSAMLAIAAMMRGARAALAADIDPFAAAAADMNAALNGVAIEATTEDLIGEDLDPATVLLAGDVTYETPLAERVRTWLFAQAARGVEVYVADPGRGFFDTAGLRAVATIEAPSDIDVDGQYLVSTPILTFDRARADRTRPDTRGPRP